MCLIALAWHAHPRYRLVLATNRDEFHARPTRPLAAWTTRPMSSADATSCTAAAGSRCAVAGWWQ